MTLAMKDLILSGKTQPTFSVRKCLISLQKLIEAKMYWLELRFFGKELIIFQQLFLFYSLIFPPPLLLGQNIKLAASNLINFNSCFTCNNKSGTTAGIIIFSSSDYGALLLRSVTSRFESVLTSSLF